MPGPAPHTPRTAAKFTYVFMRLCVTHRMSRSMYRYFMQGLGCAVALGFTALEFSLMTIQSVSIVAARDAKQMKMRCR